MAISIARQYHWSAGHWLPGVPETHKCHGMHGHNYVAEIEVEQLCHGVDDTTGFVIDYWDLDAVVQPVLGTIDHKMLNDIPGLQNPTAENIAAWLSAQIREKLLRVTTPLELLRVTIWEEPGSSATHRPTN